MIQIHFDEDKTFEFDFQNVINKNIIIEFHDGRRHPFSSDHRNRHPLALFLFSLLVTVTEMVVKTQPTPNES